MTDALEVGMKLHAKYTDGEFYLAEVVAVKQEGGKPVKVSFVGYDDKPIWMSLDSLKAIKTVSASEVGKEAGSMPQAAKKFLLAKPKIEAPLDKGFRPLILGKKKYLEDAKEQLRVKTLAGENVVALTKEQAIGLTVLQLRDMVLKARGVDDEVKLVFQVRQLEEEESLEDLMKIEDPCEVVCITQQLLQFDPKKGAFDQLDVLRGLLESSSQDYQLLAARKIRKEWSVTNYPPIDEVIKSGVLARLVKFAQKSESPQLQFEALWTFTNAAAKSTEQIRQLAESGLVQVLVEVLKVQVDKGAPEGTDEWALGNLEQAVWALGNLAADGPKTRDMCLELGVLDPLLQVLQWNCGITLKRKTTWAFSHCCRSDELPPAFEQFLRALPILKNLLDSDDNEVLSDALWAVSYLSSFDDTRFTRNQAIIDIGFSPRLMELLPNSSILVQRPALRCVGNFFVGYKAQTQAVLDCGLLEKLKDLLTHTKGSIRKEAFWVLSNVCAYHTQAVIQSGYLPIISGASEDTEIEVKKEAIYCICNLCHCSKTKELASLVQPLLTCLRGLAPDDKIEFQKKILDDFSSIITKDPLYRSTDFIEKMQHLASDEDQDEEVRCKAKKILEVVNQPPGGATPIYFGDEKFQGKDVQDENINSANLQQALETTVKVTQAPGGNSAIVLG
jgi:hypothetical protein